jgi:hypothetical protein
MFQSTRPAWDRDRLTFAFTLRMDGESKPDGGEGFRGEF